MLSRIAAVSATHLPMQVLMMMVMMMMALMHCYGHLRYCLLYKENWETELNCGDSSAAPRP